MRCDGMGFMINRNCSSFESRIDRSGVDSKMVASQDPQFAVDWRSVRIDEVRHMMNQMNVVAC